MNKKLLTSLLCCLLFIAGAGNLSAAQKKSAKGVKPIICAITAYYECNAEKGCVARSAAELDAPSLFRIWIKKRRLNCWAPRAKRTGSARSRRKS